MWPSAHKRHLVDSGGSGANSSVHTSHPHNMAKNQPHHELKILQHFNPFEEFDNEEIEKYKAQFDK